MRWISCLLLVAFLAGCAAEPPPEPVEPEASPVPAAPDKTRRPPPPPRPQTISIANVGDMMLGTDFPENHLPDDDGVSFLADVAPILRSADITVGNLEGVLMDGGTPRKECKNPQACYLFRTPSRYSSYLVDAGFDVMSLANNHSRDFGEEGRTASMQNLAAAGIEHTGREGDFAFVDAKGLRVAVLGYAVTLNSNLVLDYDIAAEVVGKIAAENDIVVITFHAGAEGGDATRIPFKEETYYGEMRGDVVKFARMMVDVGADLVVGHGPHVVRGMEVYKDRLIAYSLGNFATYYGISVEDLKGIAPILVANLDRHGRFIDGMIHSTVQIRPAGPSIDPDNRVFNLLRQLSELDFGNSGIEFADGGAIRPIQRPALQDRYTPSPYE